MTYRSNDFGLLTAIDPVTHAVTDLWPPEYHVPELTVDVLAVNIHWALAYMLQVRTNSPIVLLGTRSRTEEHNGRLTDYDLTDYDLRRNNAMPVERMRRFTTQAMLAKSNRSHIECVFNTDGFNEAWRSDLWIATHAEAHRRHDDLILLYPELTTWLNGNWFSCRKVNEWLDAVIDAGVR
jgi:hypothetical protein